jgi:hypothetical protein
MSRVATKTTCVVIDVTWQAAMRQEPDGRGSDVGATDDLYAPLRRHDWAQTDRRTEGQAGPAGQWGAPLREWR